jgi:hypothetical protein
MRMSDLSFNNGTSGPIEYGAKGGGEWPFPEVRVNGQEVPYVYRCGSGAMLHSIESRASAEFRVAVYEFENVPAQNDLITVGFYLRKTNAEFSDATFSEPFVLPIVFRRSIEQWHSDQERRWGK